MNPEFKRERFDINKDVYFTIEIAYFDGHPIAKTKTLKLYYHSKNAEEMSTQSSLGKSLMMNGMSSQFAVNLVNYLCRLINRHNLYHVYANNDNSNDRAEEMNAYISHENQTASNRNSVTQPGAGLRSRFEFSKGLLDSHRMVNKEALEETRDESNPEVISSIDELGEVPIWNYVHPKLLKNQASTIHICHLAFILERLVHNSKYPEFNNQAAMSLLLKANEAKETNQTLEQITEIQYKAEIKRLRDELNGVIKQRDDVITEFRAFRAEANAKFEESAQREQQLINEAQHANAQRDEIQATLQLQTQQLQETQITLNETQATLNQERDANIVFRNNVNQAIVDIKHQVDERFTQASEFIDNKLSGLNLTTATTTWLFIVIKRPSLTQRLRDRHVITQQQLVLDTICCKRDDRLKELRKHEYDAETDEILLERPCSNSLDLSHFMKRRFDPTIAYCLNRAGECFRKIVYMSGAEDNVIQQLGLHLATALNVKQQIAETLDGNQLATRDYIDERFNQLEAQQQLHHQQEMEAINELAEEVHELVQTIADMLAEAHPHARSIYHRYRYRELHIEENGDVWCEDIKGGARYYLTIQDIENARFR